MISPQDLRIGNKVFDTLTEEVHTLHAYDISRFENPKKVKWCERFIPIDITEEGLIQFGFKKQKASELYLEYANDLFIVVNCLMEVHLGFDVEVYFEIEYEHIESIHQLQNLYWCLVGKELQLK